MTSKVVAFCDLNAAILITFSCDLTQSWCCIVLDVGPESRRTGAIRAVELFLLQKVNSS